MKATQLSAGTICLSLVLSASALAQSYDRQASRDDSLRSSAPSLISNDAAQLKRVPVFNGGDGPGGGGGISEGVKLETLLWGGGGAIIGSLAGPVGTIAGGAVGFLVGLTIGIIMPRKQSSAEFRG